jgi:hypothetical protein
MMKTMFGRDSAAAARLTVSTNDNRAVVRGVYFIPPLSGERGGDATLLLFFTAEDVESAEDFQALSENAARV